MYVLRNTYYLYDLKPIFQARRNTNDIAIFLN